MPNTQPDSQPSQNAPRPGASRPPAGPRNSAGNAHREELSRHDREVRLTKVILMGAAGVVALVLLILGFGYWREYVARSSDAVATVGPQKITLEQYARRLDFRRIASEQQIQILQSQSQSVAGNEALADMFRQQLQQLQFGMALLPEQTLDQMVAEEVVRQEAARRGITAAPEEIDGQIQQTFTKPAAAAPTADPAQPGATPAPVATPAAATDFQVNYSEFLTSYGLKSSDYRRMVETQLLYEKLEKDMGASVPTSAEQVHARHILVEGEDKAKELAEKLKAGGNFEGLATAESQDPGSKDKGGDLGWFPKGLMAEAFENAAFQLAPNQMSDPVQTTFGWHIIQTLEKDQNRPLDEQMLQQRRQAVASEWLDGAMKGPGVQRDLSEDEKSWVFRQIKWQPPY